MMKKFIFILVMAVIAFLFWDLGPHYTYTNLDPIDTIPKELRRIGQCESEFRQFNDDGSVLRGKINNQDVGIFQINEYYWLEESIRLGYDIYTRDGNIGMAKHIYRVYGTAPWNWSKHCWGVE